ncbi:MAG TPA: archease [Geobacteraceae bacterium]|nr:archease [Geobacteraceae bacterium]
MPYRFLEDIAIADVAFEATGRNREELFISAADALLNVMVDDPATVRLLEQVEFRVEEKELDMLLFNFLNELVFFKDARQLLLRVSAVEFRRSGGSFGLSARAGGERPDPARHPLIVDVKAVTLHRFRVEKKRRGWRAEVVLDI